MGTITGQAEKNFPAASARGMGEHDFGDQGPGLEVPLAGWPQVSLWTSIFHMKVRITVSYLTGLVNIKIT